LKLDVFAKSSTKRDKITGWRLYRRYLITGFLALAPLVITIFLLWKSFIFLDGLLGYGINLLLRDILGIHFFGEHFIPGIGFVALLFLLLLTGFAAHNVFGRWVFTRMKQFILQVPLVNRIYNAIEQISQAIFSGKREVFKKAVLIEYPRKGIYSIAIMTSETSGHIQDLLPEDSISVFVPTTPNPTSGFLLFVPKREIIDIDISVEEALKLIISAGTISALDDDVLGV